LPPLRVNFTAFRIRFPRSGPEDAAPRGPDRHLVEARLSALLAFRTASSYNA